MKRHTVLKWLSIIPIVFFVLLGICDPSIRGCGWMNAYLIASPLSILLIAIFAFKKEKINVFLLSSAIYLSLGALFILVKYETGLDFFNRMMASGFFLVFFLVLLARILYSSLFNSFMIKETHSPVLAIILYLAVVLITYYLREKAVWVSIIPFLIVKIFLDYLDNRKKSD